MKSQTNLDGVKMDSIIFKNYFAYTIKYVRGKWRFVIFLQALLLLSALMNLSIALVTQQITDLVFIRHMDRLLPKIAITFVVIFIISYGSGILSNYLTSYVQNKIDCLIKLDFFDRLQKCPYEFLLKINSSEIYYRMFKDISSMVTYLISLIVSIPVQILYIACIITQMMRWSPLLTTYTAVLLVLQIINVIFFKSPIRKIINKQRTQEQNLVYKVNEHFEKIDITKVLGLEKIRLKEITKIFNRIVNTYIKNTFILNLYQSFSGLVNQMWYIGLLFIAAGFINANQLTVGAFLGFYMLSNSLFPPVLALVNTLINFQECKVSYLRYREYYNHVDNLEYGGTENFKFESSLTIRNLQYDYKNSNSNSIFNNASTEFKPGQMAVIVGKSGEGKTTLTRIVSRLLKPESGSIMIDGKSIYDINHKEYLDNVGFLLQRPLILDDTIRANLSMGFSGYSDEELEQALRDTNLFEMVLMLPDKMDTLLGTNGIKLSEGEAQRLSLARLFLRKAKILWLDEPTSALDLNNEKDIISILNKYKEERNALVVVITHRTHVIKYADVVVRIEKGKITKLDTAQISNLCAQ